MYPEIQIDIANQIIATGLVDQVYHSCELIKKSDESVILPAYKKGAEYITVGPDDSKTMFAYVRSNGPMVVEKENRVASCSKAYDALIPLRIVFFHNNEERNPDVLILQLSKFIFSTSMILQRILIDKFRLAKEESSLQRTRFDANVFYAAVDIQARKTIQLQTCEVDLCENFENPICKP